MRLSHYERQQLEASLRICVIRNDNSGIFLNSRSCSELWKTLEK